MSAGHWLQARHPEQSEKQHTASVNQVTILPWHQLRYSTDLRSLVERDCRLNSPQLHKTTAPLWVPLEPFDPSIFSFNRRTKGLVSSGRSLSGTYSPERQCMAPKRRMLQVN